MKNSTLQRTLILIAGVALAIAARTAEAKLTIGNPAPKLQVAQWVQGDPVNGFDTNHIYIVEFWATWCGPCRASIPHLNELWQKFKDKGLIAIGQDVWEPDDSTVSPFVKKMGDKMTYRIALDDKSQETNGFMAVNWMNAADQHGIPTAFVINKQGLVAWIGHPMGLNEKLLNDVLSDHYDMAKAAAEYEKQQQLEQQWMDLSRKLSKSLKDKNWDDAEAAVAGMEKLEPEARDNFGTLHLEILFGRNDYTNAYKLANSLSDSHPKNASLQNAIAWLIATQPASTNRDLALAEKCATHANDATQGKEPAVLDTLARVQFMSGKTNEAVATEQKAVDIAQDEEKNFYKKFLADYQQGKLPQINQ